MCPDGPVGPAPLTRHVVDGLAVLRRRPPEDGTDRPVVVLVHGAMDRAASFGRTMRRLGDLDVIAYDRRGYDGSLDAARPGGATLAEHAADLGTVCRWAADRDGRPVVVVGHSLGGTVALVLAATGGAGPSALGLFECPVPSLPSYRSDAADAALAAADELGPAAAAESFYRLLVGDRTWERLRDADRERRRAEGSALVAELVDLRRPGAVPEPSGVAVPVVVGVGEVDGYWARSATELADALPFSSLRVLDGAGHGAHLARPDDFARYVREAAATP